MRLDNMLILVLMSTICVTVCISTLIVLAQSASPTPQPVISLPAHMTEGPVPGAIICGYVFDEDGKPIPNVPVTLWQDDHRWAPDKYELAGGTDNPHMTNIPHEVTSNMFYEGSFIFGSIYPGEYTLTAEEAGYKSGPVIIRVVNETMMDTILGNMIYIMANVTINGYHVPKFTQEQLSYNGAIAGTIRGTSGSNVTQANVSLWEDGQMVDMPGNPQASSATNFSGRTVDYAFDHLAPGHYTILVQYYRYDNYTDTSSVDVGNETVMADIISRQVMPSTPTPISTPDASSTPEAKPTPALSGFFTFLVISFIIYCIGNKK